MQGIGKKLKPIRYGPFTIVAQVGNNTFRLDLPSYIQIYSLVNVENLKLYEPPVIVDQEKMVLPSVDDFIPEHMSILPEDTVLEKNECTARSGQHKVWCIGLKGQHPQKAKWYKRDRVRELFPHLVS